MVCVIGNYSNSGGTLLWLLHCDGSVAGSERPVWILAENKVSRSFNQSRHSPTIFLQHYISIFHHSTSHSSISLTSNFSHHLFALYSLTTLICLPQCISQPTLLFPLPVHNPSSRTSSSAPSSIFLSACCVSLGSCFSPSLSFSFCISIASSCLLTHHKGYAWNSSGVALSGGTGLSRSWWMCVVCLKQQIWDKAVCRQH